MRRETTALQRKLETMAQQIGNFGLAAAVFSLAAMAGQFTWHTFYVEGQAWDLKYLSEYLSYVITAITIVVGCPANTPPCCAQGTLEQAVILKRLDVLSRMPSGTLTHHHPGGPCGHIGRSRGHALGGGLQAIRNPQICGIGASGSGMGCKMWVHAGGGHSGGPAAGSDNRVGIQREAHAGRQQSRAQPRGRRDHGLCHHHLY